MHTHEILRAWPLTGTVVSSFLEGSGQKVLRQPQPHEVEGAAFAASTT
jgi:hypothetical protein